MRGPGFPNSAYRLASTPVNTPALESHNTLSLPQLFAMLAARRGFIIRVTAGIFLLTLLLSLLMPKTWTASADIYIDYRENDPIGGQKLSAMLDDSYMQTQLDLLRSQRVAENVIDAADLRDTPSYRQRVAENGDERADQQLVSQLLNNTSVQHARGSRVVTVSYDGRSPQQARDMANAVVEAYIHLGEQMSFTAARSRLEQYNAQLEQLRKEVDTVQTRLTDYQQENDILNVQEHGDQETQKLNDLNKTLVNLQNGLQEARANQLAIQQMLKSGLSPEELPIVNQTSVINMLKSQLGYVERELGEVQGSLGPRHPTIQGLNTERQGIIARINREAQAVLVGAESDITRLTDQISELEAEITQQRSKVLTQMQQRNQISAYQRQLASSQQVYNAALQRYDALIMASNIMSPNVAILRAAELPSSPSKPKILINLVLGLAAGLLAAVFFALALELLRRRVHIAEDLQSDPELPLLGQTGPQEYAL